MHTWDTGMAVVTINCDDGSGVGKIGVEEELVVDELKTRGQHAGVCDDGLHNE